MATSVVGTDDGAGFGVRGEATGGDGVVGTTRGARKVAVRGTHTGHINAIAIRGELGSGGGTAAVLGLTGGNSGVPTDISASGVWGDSNLGPGVSGTSSASAGVVGQGPIGILGATHGTNAGTVLGNLSGFAGFFIGNVGIDGSLNVNADVNVIGDVKLLGGDVAEEFGVVGDVEAEPGSVMVLAGDDSVRVSDEPYDRKVAGVVSGAGDQHPGLILDRKSDAVRRPLALTGKVWCKVDADLGSIELGDALTTSPTIGHAMRATDPTRAFGAVIGKALGSLDSGRGLSPVLVALQ
jgi:hypothetical protein